MNRLSLHFKSQILEQRFQKEIRGIYSKIFLNILTAYFFIVGIPCIIISTIKWNTSDVIVYSISSSTCITYSLVLNYFPQYYNLWINSLNLFASFMMGGQIYLFGPTTGIHDDYVLFYFGAAGFSLHITVAFLSSNFIMTLVQTFSSTVLYYSICWSPQIYAYKYAYGAFTLFVLFFIYLIQKNRREIFLLREYEKDWVQIVKKGLSSSIITVKYDQKDNSISLDMINEQAKKLLQLATPQEFKDFSRRTVIIDKFEDHEEQESIAKLEQRNQFYMQQKQKKEDKSKKTLENRIINILKMHIIHKMKLNQKSNPKNEQKMDKSVYVDEEIIHQGIDNQIEDLFYGIFKKSEDSTEKRISIKASTYQNQADCYCCLVIEEETNNQKVKILERVNKSFERNFFQFCLFVGDKLQNIAMNIQNVSNIKANICQCYNTIYNYKDHIQLIKNQFKMKINNLNISQITLEQLRQSIFQRYVNKTHEIDLKIKFINCNSDTVVNTFVEKLNQLIMNLVDNSVKFQQTNQLIKNRYLFPVTPLKQSSRFRSFSKSQTYVHSILKPNDHARLDQDLTETVILQKDIKQFKDLKIDFKNSLTAQKENNIFLTSKVDVDDIQLDQRQQNDQVSINQNSSLQKDVTIQFELIKGECEESNIFKITIIDYGKGLSHHKLLKLLQIIGTKNPAYNPQFQNFDYLGWKINYHIIGNIGPFYNFFVKSSENQGLEYHFYIFQDIKILYQNDQNQTKIFSNNHFQEYLEKSNQNFYHINNLNEQLAKIRKQSEENNSNIKSFTPLQQSIKFSTVNQNKVVENNTDTHSLFGYQSMILTDDFTSQQIIPPKNLNYQLATKFILDKTPPSSPITYLKWLKEKK
ncbi:transmembrane protein, putative (macronuclear) [Tetrahymena thermophila SB210]|uniref:Transmembrane protein, putative n=1 Tax=Tetrahymena thermophila (strain SB210) TaxID=312017 RepID=I7LV50_TETTS|nr:transmembrane protein, putative [Tetrahymena thermophila SB210]EAR97215.2 transmembrane protein, putative [Tetrahymena thermophila SB210]|eukprot:XP_001017460.2 transmembrane protein, putative [Tetrahymena thermophila SB210]